MKPLQLRSTEPTEEECIAGIIVVLKEDGEDKDQPLTPHRVIIGFVQRGWQIGSHNIPTLMYRLGQEGVIWAVTPETFLPAGVKLLVLSEQEHRAYTQRRAGKKKKKRTRLLKTA